jgi:hypothetical protein
MALKRAAAPEFLKNSVIVVCHPDDEVLWFGSILDRVDDVIIAYEGFWAHPEIASSRATALANFPRSVHSLKLEEAGTYGMANWANPKTSPYGIAFKPVTRALREEKRRTKIMLRFVTKLKTPVSQSSVSKNYAKNYNALLETLRPRLTPEMNVFTHNPWGEYGHEDHVQMFRALDQLRREIGFTLWMSNYCTERSLPLARRYFQHHPETAIRLAVNKPFCNTVMDVYKQAGCWTWAGDWSWFDEECFLQAPRAETPNEPHRHLFPLNIFSIEQN